MIGPGVRAAVGGRKRPHAVTAALLGACAAHPQQRVAQVLVNALGTDPFYMNDDEVIRKLNEYAGVRP